MPRNTRRSSVKYNMGNGYPDDTVQCKKVGESMAIEQQETLVIDKGTELK